MQIPYQYSTKISNMLIVKLILLCASKTFAMKQPSAFPSLIRSFVSSKREKYKLL